MQSNVLTLLGCSSSIALALLTGNATQANAETALQEYVFTAPDAPVTALQTIADRSQMPCECSNSNNSDNSDASVDLEGDRALKLYGCDCAGCRFMASNAGSEF